MEKINDIWSILTKELRRGTVDPKHPYRYGTLCTMNAATGPSARTVVIRKILDDLSFLIYTDQRTTKVSDIKADGRIALLFYHPKKREQIRINGTAELITSGSTYASCRDKISDHGARDYNSAQAPGTAISDGEIERGDQLHFCLLQITGSTVDFLKIDRPEHTRVSFQKEGDNWEGVKVIP